MTCLSQNSHRNGRRIPGSDRPPPTHTPRHCSSCRLPDSGIAEIAARRPQPPGTPCPAAPRIRSEPPTVRYCRRIAGGVVKSDQDLTRHIGKVDQAAYVCTKMVIFVRSGAARRFGPCQLHHSPGQQGEIWPQVPAGPSLYVLAVATGRATEAISTTPAVEGSSNRSATTLGHTRMPSPSKTRSVPDSPR